MSEESKANWLKLAWNRDPLSVLALLAAFLLALFTGLQWHALADATGISGRAWVTVKSVQFTNLTVGQKPVATITPENTGKSPAADFTVRGLITLTGIPLQPGPMPMVEAIGRRSVGVLGPGMASFNFAAQLEHTLTPDEIESMKNGRLFLFAFGEVRYRDIFGIQHGTQYCFEPAPSINGSANVCGQWNTLN